MKRILAAGAAALSSLLLLTGCGGASSQEAAESSSRQERVSTNPLDQALIGDWLSGTNGFRFGEDRKVALLVDATSMLYFKDGELVLVEDDKDVNPVEFDGKSLKVTYTEKGMDEPISIIEMERLDQGKPGELDGEYSVTGGAFFKVFTNTFSISEENADIEAVIDGESFNMTVKDYCSYEISGGNTLEMFSPDMEYVDETATSVKYTYSISGDTLTLTYGDQEPVEYTRVK